MRVKPFLAAGVVVALGVALTACSSQDNAPPVAASCTEKHTVIVQNAQTVPSVSRLDIYIAETLGYFAEECIAIQIQYANGGTVAAQLIGSGQADLGPVLMEPIIQGYNKGIKGKFFFQKSKNMTIAMAVKEDSPIKSWKDLEGKKIGVQALSSPAISITKAWMLDAGADYNTLSFLPVGIDQSALVALDTGQVDALALAHSAFAVLEVSGKVPLRYLEDDKMKGFGNDGYFVNQDYLDKNPEVLKRFARAISKGIVFLAANPEAAAKIYFKYSPSAISLGLDATVQSLKAALEVLDPSPPYGKVNTEALATYIDKFSKADGVADPPTVDEMSTNEFIDFANDFDADAIRAEAKAYRN